MPLCPQITNTPITVTLTSDFTVTNVIPVLPANTQQLAATDAQVAIAIAEAEAAAAASATALQVSSNTIVNSSNQLTAINGTGITVYSGASATSGARVVLNSAGLAGFNSSGTSTFAIDASNGNVSVTGTVNANAGYFGTPTNGFSINSTGLVGVGTGLISGGSISGSTITGGIVQTSTGGNSLVLDGAQNAIGVKNGGSYVGWVGSIGTAGLVLNYGSSPNVSGYPQSRITSTSANIAGSTSSAFSANSNGTTGITGNLTVFDTLTVSGVTTFNNAENSFPNITSSTSAANVRWGTTTNGRLFQVVASSERFKENIVELDTVYELNSKKLLELPVRAFSYKSNYLNLGDERSEIMVPGFITEEMDTVYPIAVDYENGLPHNWNEKFVIPGMLALIQDLYKEIKLLKGE